MRFAKATLLLAVVLAGIMASGSALAHGGHHHHGHHHRSHVHFGLFIGAPAFWYYPPVYYYPPAVAVSYSGPVYIERGDTRAAPEQSQGYWYYCPEARAYYPYVQQCAGGWQRVVPQPPPPGG